MILNKEQKLTYIEMCKTYEGESEESKYLRSRLEDKWEIKKVRYGYDDCPYYLFIDNGEEGGITSHEYKVLKNVPLLSNYKIGDKVRVYIEKARIYIVGTIKELCLNEHALIGAWVSVEHWLVPMYHVKGKVE